MFLNKSTDILFPPEITLTSTSFQRQVVHCQHDNLKNKPNKDWDRSMIKGVVNLEGENLLFYILNSNAGEQRGKRKDNILEYSQYRILLSFLLSDESDSST